MIESNIRNCKSCQQPVTRTLVGKFDTVNKKYTNEHGKLWNGSVCPNCVVLKAREHMRAKRAVNKT